MNCNLPNTNTFSQPRPPSWGISAPSQLGDQTPPPSFPGRGTEVYGHPCPLLLLTLGRHHPPNLSPETPTPALRQGPPAGPSPRRDEDPRRGIPLPTLLPPPPTQFRDPAGDPYGASISLPDPEPQTPAPRPGPGVRDPLAGPEKHTSAPRPRLGPQDADPRPGHGSRRPRTPFPARGCSPRPRAQTSASGGLLFPAQGCTLPRPQSPPGTLESRPSPPPPALRYLD